MLSVGIDGQAPRIRRRRWPKRLIHEGRGRQRECRPSVERAPLHEPKYLIGLAYRKTTARIVPRVLPVTEPTWTIGRFTGRYIPRGDHNTAGTVRRAACVEQSTDRIKGHTAHRKERRRSVAKGDLQRPGDNRKRTCLNVNRTDLKGRWVHPVQQTGRGFHGQGSWDSVDILEHRSLFAQPTVRTEIDAYKLIAFGIGQPTNGAACATPSINNPIVEHRKPGPTCDTVAHRRVYRNRVCARGSLQVREDDGRAARSATA